MDDRPFCGNVSCREIEVQVVEVIDVGLQGTALDVARQLSSLLT